MTNTAWCSCEIHFEIITDIWTAGLLGVLTSTIPGGGPPLYAKAAVVMGSVPSRAIDHFFPTALRYFPTQPNILYMCDQKEIGYEKC